MKENNPPQGSFSEMRKNLFQRQLTQQLIDKGTERDYAIRHAAVSISINFERYESEKPLLTIIRDSIMDFIDSVLVSKNPFTVDLYNQKDPASDRFMRN